MVEGGWWKVDVQKGKVKTMGNTQCTSKRKKGVDKLKRKFLVQLLTLYNAAEIPCRLIKNWDAYSWQLEMTGLLNKHHFAKSEKNASIAGLTAAQASLNAVITLMDDECAYPAKPQAWAVPCDVIGQLAIDDQLPYSGCRSVLENQDKIYKAVNNLLKKIPFSYAELDLKRIKIVCMQLLDFTKGDFIDLAKTCPQGLGNYLRNTWRLLDIAQQIASPDSLGVSSSSSNILPTLEEEFCRLLTRLDDMPGVRKGCYTRLFAFCPQELQALKVFARRNRYGTITSNYSRALVRL